MVSRRCLKETDQMSRSNRTLATHRQSGVADLVRPASLKKRMSNHISPLPARHVIVYLSSLAWILIGAFRYWLLTPKPKDITLRGKAPSFTLSDPCMQRQRLAIHRDRQNLKRVARSIQSWFAAQIKKPRTPRPSGYKQGQKTCSFFHSAVLCLQTYSFAS